MINKNLKFVSSCLFLIFALAQTACSIKVASDNNISGNQIASNNLNGLGAMPAAAGAAAMPANNLPILPASMNPAAEQARVRNVITAMSQSNNPFAEVAISDNSAPSRVVASHQPVNVPQAVNEPAPVRSQSAQGSSAATTVAQQSQSAPSYGPSAAGNATR